MRPSTVLPDPETRRGESAPPRTMLSMHYWWLFFLILSCSCLHDQCNTGVPSPPQTPSYTVQQYGRDNVVLTVQWQSPQDDGGAPVDNYTFTVTPGGSSDTIPGTSTLVTLSYNVDHNVSIVATNCNGSSTAALVTIGIVNCSDPATPGNGFIEPYQNTTEGAEISFRCNSQFVPSTTRMAVCGADARWNPDPATHVCTFDCDQPPVPRNGSLESYTDTTEGSVVFYSCDPGRVPVGRMMANCTRSGWSPNPGNATCTISCSVPTPPGNGSIAPIPNTLEGAEVSYGCNEGFVPNGQRMTMCRTTGNWTRNPADLVCTPSPIECRDPTPAAGVTVEPYNTTLVGSVILYQCEQSGFTPSSASSTCETNEMWSPDPSQVVCSIIPPLPTGMTPSSTSDTTPTGPPASDPSSGGTSGGAIAAIIIVLLVVAVLVVAVVIVVVVL